MSKAQVTMYYLLCGGFIKNSKSNAEWAPRSGLLCKVLHSFDVNYKQKIQM